MNEIAWVRAVGTLVASFIEGRDVLAANGGAAIVIWKDRGGDPLVLTSDGVKFAVVVARWLTTTQPLDVPPPATPRNDGGTP